MVANSFLNHSAYFEENGMGYIVALIVGLSLERIWNSSLVKGKRGLGKTFWLYGVIGGSVLVASAVAYFLYSQDQANQAGSVIGLYGLQGKAKMLAYVVSLYCFFIYVAIWNAGKQARLRYKILSRWAGVSMPLMPLVVFPYAWLYFVISAIAAYIKPKIIGAPRVAAS